MWWPYFILDEKSINVKVQLSTCMFVVIDLKDNNSQITKSFKCRCDLEFYN